MPKNKAQPAESLPDGANDLTVMFYISDATAPGGAAPWVKFSFKALSGPLTGVAFDHPLTDYSSLTPAQKTQLRASLLLLRDETFTLEGYT